MAAAFGDEWKKQAELASPKLPQKIRDGVLQAVTSLGNRVTVGDVAGASGLKVADVEEGLRALAADTQATLQVSNAGEVVYVFKTDPRAALLARSWLLRVEPALNWAKSAAGYLLRVTFGTTLIASIALVATAIYVILTSSTNERDERRRGPNMMSFGGGGFYPTDLLWYWNPNYYRRRQYELAEGNEMGFLESVFSFVFGDGDPNDNLDALRYEQIANVIKANGGVVTAEQLLPWLDVSDPGDPDSVVVEESYVVPVLQRFQGSPLVGATGGLLYEFPSFQTSAALKAQAGVEGGFLVEDAWRFSAATKGQLVGAGALGVLNLAGVTFLASLLRDPRVLQAALESGSAALSLAAGALPLLQVYAAAFFVIPGVRLALSRRTNARIAARNATRAQQARALAAPSPALRLKLDSGRGKARRQVVGAKDVMFDTSKDMTDPTNDVEGREFDKMLEDRERRSQGKKLL